MMKRLLEWGAYALVFLLPWQTVLVVQQKTIGRADTLLEGVWQYGGIRLYAIEGLVLLLILVVLALTIYTIFIRGIRVTAIAWYRSRFFVLDACLSLFVVLSLGSVLWALDRSVAMMGAVRIFEGVFLFVLFRTLQLRTSLLASVALGGAVLQGGIGGVQFLMQGTSASTLLGIAAHDPSTLGDAVVQAGDRRWLRAYGAFPHPNILGAYLAIGMVVCAMALSRAREKWQWVVLLVASQIMLVGLFLTFSRSAWLAVIVAGVAWLAIDSFSRSKRGEGEGQASRFLVEPIHLMLLVSVVVAGIMSFYFFDEVKGRVGIEPSRIERQSLDERVSLVSRAIPLVHDVWYRGSGIGNFTNTLFQFEEKRGVDREWYTYQPLHNVFLMIFAELGLFGLIVVLVMAFFIIRSAPVSTYPLLFSLGALSLFDHFLWTLPVGIFLSAIVLGWSC